jgi:drug/metabolite transporter (DMT)-like permease
MAVIFFKRSGETVSPFALNFFRVTVSGLVFLAILLITGQELIYPVAWSDYLLLALSGILGIAVSDTFFHRCLNLVGAGITAIVDCLYSPFIVLFAFLLLGERLGPWQLLGMALVIGGVLLTSRHRPPAGATRRQLLMGIAWGVLAMGTLGLGIVIAKPVLERTPVLWASTLRALAAVAVMLPAALISTKRRRILGVFVPKRDWRFSLPGTALGSCLALLFWIGGMKYAKAGTAAILNQTSTIYVLLFAALFLKEPFTRRKVLAAALAVSGILMVILG